MKILKSIFASFILLALTTAFATKSHAQTTVNQEIVWTGTPAFVIADESSTARLTNTANWSALQAITQVCTGTSKLCKATISYTYSGIDPAPTVQQIINALSGIYVPDSTPATHTGHFTSNTTTFTVPGFPSVIITVTVFEKA